jgi:thiamine biosynthesis protein ThiS
MLGMSNTLEQLRLTVNGEPMVLTRGTTLAGLIAELGLDTRKVAVERNLEIVPRSTYGAVVLDEADALEIVHFIGGG